MQIYFMIGDLFLEEYMRNSKEVEKFGEFLCVRLFCGIKGSFQEDLIPCTSEK